MIIIMDIGMLFQIRQHEFLRPCICAVIANDDFGITIVLLQSTLQSFFKIVWAVIGWNEDAYQWKTLCRIGIEEVIALGFVDRAGTADVVLEVAIEGGDEGRIRARGIVGGREFLQQVR